MRSADVVIVGAGVIGTAIAYTLSRVSRLRIVLVDRATPGCEASNAAAGVLGVASAPARRGVLLELRRRSAAMFPELVAMLEDETRLDLGYRREGLLSLAWSDAEMIDLAELVRHRQRQQLPAELLDGAALRALEPSVSAAVCGAAWFPADCWINAERLVAALADAARRRGVELRMHTAVRAIVSEGGQACVCMDSGTVAAAVVVVAAGAWSPGLLEGNGVKIPVRPARGEMAAVRLRDASLRHVLASSGTYLVPSVDDAVLIGSTTAFVGFDARVTEQGVAMLLAQAVAMVPAVDDAPVLRTWAGLRPCSTIHRPIIAPLPGVDHIILATGHHRNGILLAPITAQMVAEMILGTAPSVPLRPFSYRRH